MDDTFCNVADEPDCGLGGNGGTVESVMAGNARALPLDGKPACNAVTCELQIDSTVFTRSQLVIDVA